MAIEAPDNLPMVDLTPSRGSKIQPRDTYAKPAVPPDNGDAERLLSAMNSLSGSVNAVAKQNDQQQQDQEKQNIDLYASRVMAGMQNGTYDPNAANNILSPLHEANRFLVAQRVGTLQGAQDALSATQNLPQDVVLAPEKAAQWAQDQRNQALTKVGNIPGYAAGYMQSYNDALGRAVSAASAARTSDWNNQIINGAVTGVRSAGVPGTPIDTTHAPDPEAAASIVRVATNLGISPQNLAAVISYETGGKFDPELWGGKGGNYKGLIQFGPEERKQFGVRDGMSFSDQMNAVENYLRTRGVKPSMGLADIYSTVNAGSPGRYNASDHAIDPKTGKEMTVMDHVNNILGSHMQKGLQFLGSSVSTTPIAGTPAAAASSQGTPPSNGYSDQSPQPTTDDKGIQHFSGGLEAYKDFSKVAEGKAVWDGPAPNQWKPPAAPAKPDAAQGDTPNIYTIDPETVSKLPPEALNMHDRFVKSDTELKAVQPGLMDRHRDAQAQQFVNAAIANRDERFLDAFPPKMITPQLQTQFTAARQQVYNLKKQEHTDAVAQQTEAQEAELRELQTNMANKFVSGQPIDLQKDTIGKDGNVNFKALDYANKLSALDKIPEQNSTVRMQNLSSDIENASATNDWSKLFSDLVKGQSPKTAQIQDLIRKDGGMRPSDQVKLIKDVPSLLDNYTLLQSPDIDKYYKENVMNDGVKAYMQSTMGGLDKMLGGNLQGSIKQAFDSTLRNNWKAYIETNGQAPRGMDKLAILEKSEQKAKDKLKELTEKYSNPAPSTNTTGTHGAPQTPQRAAASPSTTIPPNTMVKINPDGSKTVIPAPTAPTTTADPHPIPWATTGN